ncbi:MAG: MATE family efflux transporter, partial [Candidatus Acidiferrales bacterium]
CSAAAFLLLPRLIARAFTPNEVVITASVSLLAVAAVFQLFDGVQGVAAGALRGAGETRIPMLSHLVTFWFVGLPMGYWLCFSRGWGAIGLWVGLCVGLVLTAIVLLAAWHRRTQRFEPETVARLASADEIADS